MENVSFEDFQKLELKIGRVEAAEPVLGADKLLKLTVDIGGEKRTLVAGVAEFYTVDEIIGKNIVVLVNLEPKTIRGITSQGMLLAADEEGKISLLTPDREVSSGTKVS